MNTVELPSLIKRSRENSHKTVFFTNNQNKRLTKTTDLLASRKHCSGVAALVASVLTLAASLLAPASAYAISGGSASSLPWVVQTMGLTNEEDASCTGSALDDLMILTAKHCTVNTIVYPDGSVVPVVATHDVPGSDIKVVILKNSHPLNKYPTLGPNFRDAGLSITEGTIGNFYGYGTVFFGPQKKMRMRSEEHGKLPEDATVEVIYMTERNGEIEDGDSGGPLLVDDMLIGVLSSTGQNAEDGHYVAVFHGLSNAFAVIRQLQHAREMRSITAENFYPGPWIRAANVANGKFSATLSSRLINSGKTVAFWVNGQYAGHVKDDISYYCSKTNFNGGSVISPSTPIKDGDLVQIGIVTTVDNPEGSELLYEKRVTGIESVKQEDGHAVIRMSSTLVNSGQRIIVWLDGRYASEVHKGTVYYGGRANADGAVTIYSGAATAATLVQIGVVPGEPGDGIGTPRTAKLLYNGIMDGRLGKVLPVQGNGELAVTIVNLP